MDNVVIIMRLRKHIKRGDEAVVELKESFNGTFVCKIASMEEDLEGFEGHFVTFKKTENSENFPSEESSFVTTLSNIKSIE